MINETIYISINIKDLHQRIIYGNLTILVYKSFVFKSSHFFYIFQYPNTSRNSFRIIFHESSLPMLLLLNFIEILFDAHKIVS